MIVEDLVKYSIVKGSNIRIRHQISITGHKSTNKILGIEIAKEEYLLYFSTISILETGVSSYNNKMSHLL